MYAIPREQIVGVGQRRFLMKRALVAIVPDEILNRKKKETVAKESSKNVATERTSIEWPTPLEIGQHMISGCVGIIDPDRFKSALEKVRRGNEEAPIESLKRTLTLESWLRHLTLQGVLTTPASRKRKGYPSSQDANELQTSTQPKSLAS
jgi:hypothetical protein